MTVPVAAGFTRPPTVALSETWPPIVTGPDAVVAIVVAAFATVTLWPAAPHGPLTALLFASPL